MTRLHLSSALDLVLALLRCGLCWSIELFRVQAVRYQCNLTAQTIDISKIDNTLYFGCRSKSKDHHYASEWKALSESQKLMYRVAFSRDGPEGVKRTYVQDLMTEDADILWDVLRRRKGWVYISG